MKYFLYEKSPTTLTLWIEWMEGRWKTK